MTASRRRWSMPGSTPSSHCSRRFYAQRRDIRDRFGLKALRARLEAEASRTPSLKKPLRLMEPLRLTAWEPKLAELPAEVAQAIKASGLVRVELERTPSTWRLVPDSRVGVVLGPDWELRVEPRLDVPKLMFLLGYARDPNGWRDFVAPMARENELFSAVASGFAAHARRAIEGGVLRGYVTVDEGSAVLRGRLRVADQIAIHAGLPLPAEIRYDDYSIDVPGIACLQLRAPCCCGSNGFPNSPVPICGACAEHSLGLARLDDRRAGDYSSHRPLRAGYGARRADLERTLNQHAPRGDHLIDVHVRHEPGFEEFLETALTEALRPYGGRVEPQLTGHYLDRQMPSQSGPTSHGGRDRASPPSPMRSTSRSPTTGSPTPMRTRCSPTAARFGWRGFLIYAKGEVDDRSHALPHDIDLRVFTVDVEHEPAAVLGRVRELAAVLATPGRPDVGLAAWAASEPNERTGSTPGTQKMSPGQGALARGHRGFAGESKVQVIRPTRRLRPLQSHRGADRRG